MSKISTLNYLINSYYAGKEETEQHQISANDSEIIEFEPSSKSIEAILNFSSQYKVLKSVKAGNIELNLN